MTQPESPDQTAERMLRTKAKGLRAAKVQVPQFERREVIEAALDEASAILEDAAGVLAAPPIPVDA